MRAPYTCPVCTGRGTVAPGFYQGLQPLSLDLSTLAEREQCKSCGGIGIVWADNGISIEDMLRMNKAMEKED